MAPPRSPNPSKSVSNYDTIEIKKDNERVEEIKALKRAWESHEAGRCIKVN
jgi:hypothetical protein